MLETGKPVSALGNDMLGALAYGGTQSICDALADGADIVITQRAGDSEQFLAPMLHEFGWSLDDHDKIASGSVSAISSNALRRSAADTSPIPATRTSPTCTGSVSRSLRWTSPARPLLPNSQGLAA